MASIRTVLIKARQLRRLWNQHKALYIKISVHPDTTPEQLREAREGLQRMYEMTRKAERLITELVGESEQAKILRFKPTNED